MGPTADLVQKTIIDTFHKEGKSKRAITERGGCLTHVNAAIHQDILEHFMLHSADKLYGDADLIFQLDLTPAHTVKVPKVGSMTMVLLCLTGQQTRLTWTP